MMIDYIRLVNAQQNFKINDDFEFIALDDITAEGIVDNTTPPEELEMFAEVKLTFEGVLPESYKVLNLLIGNWVNAKIEPLTTVLHEKVKEHITAIYPGSDHSELDNIENSVIWTEQLDYMPRIDDDLRTIIIEIELVMPTEPIGE